MVIMINIWLRLGNNRDQIQCFLSIVIITTATQKLCHLSIKIEVIFGQLLQQLLLLFDLDRDVHLLVQHFDPDWDNLRYKNMICPHRMTAFDFDFGDLVLGRLSRAGRHYPIHYPAEYLKNSFVSNKILSALSLAFDSAHIGLAVLVRS